MIGPPLGPLLVLLLREFWELSKFCLLLQLFNRRSRKDRTHEALSALLSGQEGGSAQLPRPGQQDLIFLALQTPLDNP